MTLLVDDKSVVVPGEELAVGIDYLPTAGTYRDGDKIVSSKLGLVQVDGRLIKIIPLSGKYLPKRGDVVIAKIVDITMNGWICDINSAYHAMIGVKDGVSEFIKRGADLTRYFNFGDFVVAGIINVTSQNLVDLTTKEPGLKKLGDGRIIYVNPNKIPRIIGKGASMIDMVRDATGCRLTAGQNGVIWIQGMPENELVAVNAIRKISEESHISGLTDRMKAYLDSNAEKLKK